MILIRALAGAGLVIALAAAGPESPVDPDVIYLVNDEPLRLRDLEHALFLDDHDLVVKNILPMIVEGTVVRQKVSENNISVKASAVQAYIDDLDRQVRSLTKNKQCLEDQLKAQGMDMAFFRVEVERLLGLYYLAGGKRKPAEGMNDPKIQAKINSLVAQYRSQAKVELDLAKLPEGAAAIVNGERIPAETVGRFARICLSPEQVKRRLVEVQRFMVVRQELRRRNLEFTKDDLEFQMSLASGARATRLGEREFPMEKILEKIGSDVNLLKRQYGFMRVAMLSKMVKDQVTEEELRKLFEADPARYGDGVPKVSHILIRTSNDKNEPLPPREQRRAKERAEAVYKRVAAGEDFAKLAGELSEDKRTADSGGSLGYLDPAQRTDNPVVSAAFGLKAGDVSRPILSAAGWHVIKVAEIHRISFKDARPLVLAAAFRERRNVLEQQLVKNAVVKTGPAKL